MKTSTAVLPAVIALTILNPFFTNSSELSIENFTVSMEGGSPISDSQGRYIIIAGIWHKMDVYLDSTADKVEIILSYGDPEEKNITNYYRWTYENGVWKDSAYGVYINKNKCDKIGTLYTFDIGIDGKVSYGIWNLSIKADDVDIYSTEISVEESKVGYEIRPHLSDNPVWVEPFMAEKLNLSDDRYAIIVTNTGNFPFICNLSFSNMEDRIAVLCEDNVLYPGETQRFYLLIDIPEWSPRIIDIKVTVSMDPLYRVPTSSTAALLTGWKYGVDMRIYVGHSGYRIIQTEGFTFQKKDSLNVDYGEEFNLTAFISGNGSVLLYVKSINCTVEDVSINNRSEEGAIALELTEKNEIKINIKIKADVSDTQAKLLYIIYFEDKNNTFSTEINVGPAPASEPEKPTPPDRTVAALFVLTAAGMATAYVLLTQKKASKGVKKEGKRIKKGGRK